MLRQEATSYEALGVWLDACQPVCALLGDRGLGLEWKGTLANSLSEEYLEQLEGGSLRAALLQLINTVCLLHS